MFHWLLLVNLLSTAPPWSEANTFAPCRSAFSREPDAWQSSDCFYKIARERGLWTEAARELETLYQRYPANPWLPFYRGRIAFDSQGSAGAAWFETAIEAFKARAEVEGEIWSRLNLYKCLMAQQKTGLAGRQLELANEAVADRDNGSLKAHVAISGARHLLENAGNLERAERLLKRVEDDAFLNYSSKRDWLLTMGNIQFELGRFDRAGTYYRAILPAARERGDPWVEATALHNLITCTIAGEQSGMDERDDLIARLREALALSVKANNRLTEEGCHRILGKLSSGEEARRHLERSLAIARAREDPFLISESLMALAIELVDEDPHQALAWTGEAFEAVKKVEGLWPVLYSGDDRMRVNWKTLPEDEALADSLSALDLVEKIRKPQTGESGRIALLSRWAKPYYLLSGYLLQRATNGGPSGRFDLAFSITERMRARVLLEVLERSDASLQGEVGAPLLQRRERVNAGLVRVHRRLLGSALKEPQRESLSEELEQLEQEWAEVESRIREAAPGRALPSRMDFAGVERVREQLSDDEALLSFQIELWQSIFGEVEGGSWLLVITHEHSRAYRLPDQTRLNPAVETFLGLLRDDDHADAIAHTASVLYQRLLKEALAELPAGIQKLVLIPDGILHRLPFALLRAEPRGEPLALRYQVSRVPSATLWLRWLQKGIAGTDINPLVMADPLLPRSPLIESSGSGASRALEEGMRLAPLPHAREEARAVIRHLGNDGLLLLGEDASEAFLKRADLRPHGLLHFAAHAVVDEMRPHRSAVVLAPGSSDEDGLLQPRDIAALELEGKIVVLSTCQSGSGLMQRGEGVMSLARAFMRAGAHAVIGTLWPLRDDEAALLFEAFYRHLRSGESLAAALQSAQAERIEAGAPERAWSGVVVLGQGRLKPQSHRRPAFQLSPLLVTGLLLLATAIVLYLPRFGYRD